MVESETILRCRLEPSGFGAKSEIKKSQPDKLTGLIRNLGKKESGIYCKTNE